MAGASRLVLLPQGIGQVRVVLPGLILGGAERVEVVAGPALDPVAAAVEGPRLPLDRQLQVGTVPACDDIPGRVPPAVLGILLGQARPVGLVGLLGLLALFGVFGEALALLGHPFVESLLDPVGGRVQGLAVRPEVLEAPGGIVFGDLTQINPPDPRLLFHDGAARRLFGLGGRLAQLPDRHPDIIRPKELQHLGLGDGPLAAGEPGLQARPVDLGQLHPVGRAQDAEHLGARRLRGQALLCRLTEGGVEAGSLFCPGGQRGALLPQEIRARRVEGAPVADRRLHLARLESDPNHVGDVALWGPDLAHLAADVLDPVVAEALERSLDLLRDHRPRERRAAGEVRLEALHPITRGHR